METILFIDFENFRKNSESIFSSNNLPKPKWHSYNFRGLFERVLSGMVIDRTIFYYAKIVEHQQTKQKSKRLIEDRRLLKNNLEKQGFEVVVAGRVRGLGKGPIFKEKGVDVKIAIDMVLAIVDGVSQNVVIGSSDSDLQPAINEIKKRGGKCVYLGFEANSNKGIAYNCGRAILIRDSEITSFV